MPKLKLLSGQEVIKILLSFGFKVASQKGSHIKLRHILPDNAKQTLTVPNHPELDTGHAPRHLPPGASLYSEHRFKNVFLF